MVGRCLVTVFVFSLLALAFIGQMPVVAAHSLGIDLSHSPDYGILYACFGKNRNHLLNDRSITTRQKHFGLSHSL